MDNNNKLYVGNLNYSVSEKDLTDLFASYGEVKYVKIIEGKGFGFVELEDATKATTAKDELNGTDYKGRTLKIDFARPKTERPRNYR